MGSSSSAGSSMAGAGRGTFVERQQAGQFLSSKLVGTTVYGSNNERVGDVNDVLMDRDGKAQALVIGVGGFLGIGEKDVAVPFNAVEFSSGNSGTAGGASGSTSGTGTSGGTASTAGSTAGSTGGATSSSATARNDGAPDRIVLRMTKDQLNAAPQFTRLSSTSSSSTTGAGTNTGSGARTNAPGSSTSSGTSANPSTGTGAGTTR